MFSINKRSEIGGKVALELLQRIMQEEGISEEVIDSFCDSIKDNVWRKRTISSKILFEKSARLIFADCKEQLNSGYFWEASQKILQLFCDKRKSKIRLYIEDNHIIITIAVAAIVPILLFAINLFIGK